MEIQCEDFVVVDAKTANQYSDENYVRIRANRNKVLKIVIEIINTAITEGKYYANIRYNSEEDMMAFEAVNVLRKLGYESSLKESTRCKYIAVNWEKEK